VDQPYRRDGWRLRFAAGYVSDKVSVLVLSKKKINHTSSNAIRFWIRSAIRESRYRTSFSSTKFFLDCDEIFDLSSRKCFWAMRKSVHNYETQGTFRRTSRQVIRDFQVSVLCGHGQVQSGDGHPLGLADGASIVRRHGVLSCDRLKRG